jgi:RHS repeat-associated protein
MKQLRSWHLSTPKVISEPMSALARTSERDCRTRTTNENCTASESWSRTKYTYDSFGKLTASTGSLVNPFQYTARESDTETGLYYYRARYYDSSAGRFLSEDPFRFQASGSNFYSYTFNSPVNFNDPTGWTTNHCGPLGNCYPVSRNGHRFYHGPSPCNLERRKLAVKGLVNIGIGIGKVVGGTALTAGTSGIGVGVGGYLIISGFVANVGGGLSQIAGAISGDIEGGEAGAAGSAAIGTISGFLTLLGTGGDINAAATVGDLESAALPAIQSGLGEEVGPAEVVDAVQGLNNILNKGQNGQFCPKREKCQ